MADSTTARHDRVARVIDDGPGPLGARVIIGPHRYRADEPVALGGRATGPDPYEYLLAGLGACTALTLRLYAERKGWALDHVDVTVRHASRLSAGAAKDVFTRDIRLEGNLSDEQRSRLLEIAEHCPVSRTLTAGVVVESSLGDRVPAGEPAS